MTRPASESPARRLADALLAAWVTFGGLGCAPFASGSFGTLGGVALAAWFAWTWPGLYLPLVLAALVVTSVGGAAAGRWAERRYGRKDPGEFVVDEVAGYLLTVLWITPPGWTHLLAGYFFFRLTDVLKPPPARRLESVPGGWGIVLDDLVAGLYAWVLTAAFHFAWGRFGG